MIIFYHGDLEPDHLPDKQEETNWTPCVVNIHNFASVFLFRWFFLQSLSPTDSMTFSLSSSVETQHTIGYGGRMTTEECPEAIFVMSFQVNFLKFFNSYQHFVFRYCFPWSHFVFQSVVGVMIQACMVGIIFRYFDLSSIIFRYLDRSSILLQTYFHVLYKYNYANKYIWQLWFKWFTPRDTAYSNKGHEILQGHFEIH